MQRILNSTILSNFSSSSKEEIKEVLSYQGLWEDFGAEEGPKISRGRKSTKIFENILPFNFKKLFLLNRKF